MGMRAGVNVYEWVKACIVCSSSQPFTSVPWLTVAADAPNNCIHVNTHLSAPPLVPLRPSRLAASYQLLRTNHSDRPHDNAAYMCCAGSYRTE